MTSDRTKSRNKSSSDKKSGTDDAEEMPLYSPDNIQNNLRVIYYSRTFLSIVGGVVAGVLGLTSITGFLFYFAIMIITSAAVAVKAKLDIRKYFDSWNRITFDGITAGLMSFVLFWTFAYDIVHIF